MNIKTPEYFRKKKVIRGPDGDKVFPSINQAKKASRLIQQSNGGMGCGILKVVEKFQDEQEKYL